MCCKSKLIFVVSQFQLIFIQNCENKFSFQITSYMLRCHCVVESFFFFWFNLFPTYIYLGKLESFRLPSTLAFFSSKSTCSANNDEAYVNFNWDKLGFGLTPTDYIYIMKISGKDNFSEGSLSRYGNIEISPSAAIFNYGQGLFEGLKAYRRPDGGIQLFRPELNALRMKNGADRLCMPSPPVNVFVDAVKKTVLANQRWVPPPGKGSLYIRPLLMGSGAVLGIGPAPECTFLIFTSPIGNWYKCGPSMNLYVENEVPRATLGGTGAIKSITNYSPVSKIGLLP
ncbi:branched-chain-amino-acid aminotransferase 7 [Pyrus ussuriensis x Pyrus communis]|uniref:Branched-chain-amino-acid aminotransferase 7 n=1 Tax=Pyrus ussuriensis x Pyrus communis TaxID=2448454 RepID=A0A5N5I7G0_9ROSA|nr:branched-chain-amino-acid aminotransferase 7 [Pyrus ussuriensis x Pyrus communis]